MKAVIFVCIVALALGAKTGNAHDKIKQLKTKIKGDKGDSTSMVASGKIFGYGRTTKSVGQVVAKVSKTPMMVDLSPDDQQRKWFDLADSKFPLKAAGFAQWRPTRTGLIFRTDDEKSSKVCQANKHSGDNNTAIFRFNCDAATKTPEARFAKARGYYYYWVPVTDGTPYGWSGYWDNWSYSYWAMSPNGYYGCNNLVAQDWCPSDYPNCACGDKVAYYPFTSCGDSDCLPYTGAWTYANYYLPYCDSCQYISPNYYSPGCPDCPYTTVSYTYNLAQKSAKTA